MLKNLVTVKAGSNLYNLATPNSDLDLYTIYDFTHKIHRPKKQVQQKIDNETDHVKISLERFQEQLLKGVPQALEVLFSTKEHWLDWTPEWEKRQVELTKLVPANIYNILRTYRRTIIHFFEYSDFKKNRHGFRLLLNAGQLKRFGMIRPTMDAIEVGFINNRAELPWEDRIKEYKDWLWDVFGDLEE